MWKETDNKLKKEYTFSNFKEAFKFMSLVAEKAEELNHHPNWSNCWNAVSIQLSTHDAGDIITPLDYLLAEQIDLIFDTYFTNTRPT